MFILRAALLVSLALCISGLPIDEDNGKHPSFFLVAMV